MVRCVLKDRADLTLISSSRRFKQWSSEELHSRVAAVPVHLLKTLREVEAVTSVSRSTLARRVAAGGDVCRVHTTLRPYLMSTHMDARLELALLFVRTDTFKFIFVMECCLVVSEVSELCFHRRWYHFV